MYTIGQTDGRTIMSYQYRGSDAEAR